MADLLRIKDNIRKMIEQNAPESDIDEYVKIEGVTPEQLRNEPIKPPLELKYDTSTPAETSNPNATVSSGKDPNQQYLSEQPSGIGNFIHQTINALNPINSVQQLASDNPNTKMQGFMDLGALAIPLEKGAPRVGKPVAESVGNVLRKASGQIGSKFSELIARKAPIAESILADAEKAGATKAENIIPENIKTVFADFTEKLKNLKNLNKDQAAMKSEELGTRTVTGAQREAEIRAAGGTARDQLAARKSSLFGDYKKLQFTPIRVSDQTAEDIAQYILDHPLSKVDYFAPIKVNTALEKFLGGQVPAKHEIKLLNEYFGGEFSQALMDNRNKLNKLKDLGYLGLDIANIPRAIMSSIDFSAPFRQGFGLIGKKEFWQAFPDMFRAAFSEKAYKVIQDKIIANPNYNLMRESGLGLTDMGKFLGHREEQFASSIADKIPGIKASGRAYSGFLNKLRADTFSSLIADAERAGLKPQQNLKATREIANFVNIATGRGSLPGKLNDAAPVLNAIFFSPKLMSSRIQVLTNPMLYFGSNPIVRKEAWKSLFAMGGAVGTMLGLAKLSGADIETDPTSSDFLKAKIGNTRIDFAAGYQQYMRMAAQLYTGEYKSVSTGKTAELGKGYKPLTRKDIFYRQVESKEAPIPSFITALLNQQDYKGQPINIRKEITDRLTPMMVGDIIDLYKEDPKSLPIGLLGSLGMGVQTYTPQPQKLNSPKSLFDRSTFKNDLFKKNSLGL